VSNLSWTKRVKHSFGSAERRAKIKALVLASNGAAPPLPGHQASFSPTPGRLSSPPIASATWYIARCCAWRSSARFVEIAEGVEGLCHKLRKATDGEGVPVKLDAGRNTDFRDHQG